MLGTHRFTGTARVGRLELRQPPFSSDARETVQLVAICNMKDVTGRYMLSRCGHFLLVTLVRFSCARNSAGDYLTTEGL